MLFFCPADRANLRAEDDSYVGAVIDQAARLRLHEEREWHVLIHYQKTLFGYKSLIDDPKFFLAPDGRKNPESELKATIRGIFSTELSGDTHPRCRFAARFAWLKAKLDIDGHKLPEVECPRLKGVLDKIVPTGATLVFPTSHINSPASMFGHTLMTLRTGTGSALLSHAVNYTAVTNETFGPVYAVKGLLGYYPGYFSILPYYAKIQEYSDFDHRDIWEYHLNFTEEELHRMLLHIFELDFVYSDYYFFGENCSYNLLYLFDVARPSLTLTDRFYRKFPFWVIPIDTVRGAGENGMIARAEYRPSRSSMIKFIASQLSEENRKFAVALSRGDASIQRLMERDIPDDEKIKICDLASEYTQYRYSKEYISKEEYSRAFIALLGARSKLGKPETSEYSVPAPAHPDDGHLSNRIAVGAGVMKKGGDVDYFQQIKLRPSYHTLLDDDRGYVEGGQIVFFDVTLRYYDLNRRLELDNIDIIDIASLSPRDEFFKSVSWKIKTGVTRTLLDNDRDPLAFYLSPGGGFTFKSGFFGIFYMMFETEVDAGPALRDNYSVGIGGSAGILSKIGKLWKLHLYARGIGHVLGEKRGDIRLHASQGFFPSTNTSITIDCSRSIVQEGYTPSATGDFRSDELSLNFNLFF